MQRILTGLDFVSNRNHILREISACADAGMENLLLIVPENQTHDAERRLCEVCGNRISRFAEAISFQRLASRVFAQAGGGAVTAFDRGGKLLAMSKTCGALHSQLKVFRSKSNSAEYLLSLVDLCDELESSCISVKDLFDVSANLEGALAQKIEELAQIYSTYDANCDKHESALTRLAECLKTNPELVADKHIWIDGFTYMTRQERMLVHKLADYAADFTLVLTGSTSAKNDRVFGALREYAGEFQAKIKHVECIPTESGRREPILEHISKHLFSARVEQWQESSAPIILRSAPSVSDECLACADAVMKLVRSGKARFGEINVVYTDSSRYRSALHSVFSRYGIPAYYSGSEPIENQSVAAFVLTAIEAVTGGMEYEDVIRHLKTGLCAVDNHACDLLENYAYTWSVRGTRWFSEWTMHPDGFGQQETDESRLALQELNAMRDCAMRPLQKLYYGLRDVKRVEDQIRALYLYFDEVQLCKTLAERAKQVEGTQQALELSQLFEIVCTALEQMNEILGEELRNGEEFARLMRLLLTQYQVATITPYLDHIQVGSAENLYRASCRYLFVLGAEEGMLPSNVSARGPLTDAERNELIRQDIPILSGTEHNLDFAIASVWYLFTSPDSGLYVSWCAADGKAPSYLVTRIASLLPDSKIETTYPYPSILLSDAQSAGALLARAQSDEHLLTSTYECAVFSDAAVQRAADAWKERANYQLPSMSNQAVRKLYGDKLYLSASRVDQQNSCRFAYFMNYGMRAKERRAAAFDAPLFGTFVHAVLEQTARRTMAEGGFQTVQPERIGSIAEEEIVRYTEEQLASLGEAGERVRYLFERNRREISEVVDSMVKELRKSDFLPIRFELSFSNQGEMPPVQIADSDQPAEISGFVDRVDVFEKNGVLYVRVVDYKTGRKSFDYTDILSGIGLQMLIYLFALCELGDHIFGVLPQPAGVLYMPAREPLISMSDRPTREEAEKGHAAERVRKGLVLDDDAIVSAMEHFDEQPEFLPLKNGKNGRSGDIASAPQMQALRKFVMQRLRQTADEIASGVLTPNPYTRGSSYGSCSYCPYAQACHLDTFGGAVRSLAATDRKTFWEKIGQEVREYG